MAEGTNKILIISGGHIDEDFLGRLVSENAYSMIIAADRGLLAADLRDIRPDYIVGDFDSVPSGLLEKYKQMSTPVRTFPTEKDKTDTQIALELAMMHNPSVIDIAGGTGSRLDHVLANINLLLLPMQLGIKACILDSNNRIYLSDKSFTIDRSSQYGRFVSLLPFTPEVTGLSLKGFKYPLNKITMTAGSSLGISNEIIEDKAYVEFISGILITAETRD
jgi:thiamine pyrophosphokinase